MTLKVFSGSSLRLFNKVPSMSVRISRIGFFIAFINLLYLSATWETTKKKENDERKTPRQYRFRSARQPRSLGLFQPSEVDVADKAFNAVVNQNAVNVVQHFANRAMVIAQIDESDRGIIGG